MGADRVLIDNIGQLATPVPRQAPARGADQSKLSVVSDAAVLCVGGVVTLAGHRDEVLAAAGDGVRVIDAAGRAVIPGFVDCHTHLVYAGNRVDEYDRRLRGVPYLEILQSGGGILDTVRRTRSASGHELYACALQRVRTMAAFGTTTIEVKSGYGLDIVTEMATLRTVKRLNHEAPIRFVPTFMGAHATPPEYKGRSDDYIDFLISDVLPLVGQEGLAVFADIFCETGVFTLEQSERLLRAALHHGLRPKMHADELGDSGGAVLAAKLGATTADHLIRVSGAGINALAESQTIAVLLPATSVFIGSYKPAPAREMITRGVPLALATDHNPGTSPVYSMQLVMSLACSYLRLTPAEALTAATLNAGFACGSGILPECAPFGAIGEGWAADMAILEADDYREVAYYMGSNLVHATVKGGKVISEVPVGAEF